VLLIQFPLALFQVRAMDMSRTLSRNRCVIVNYNTISLASPFLSFLLFLPFFVAGLAVTGTAVTRADMRNIGYDTSPACPRSPVFTVS
jgi:hypothetical protein